MHAIYQVHRHVMSLLVGDVFVGENLPAEPSSTTEVIAIHRAIQMKKVYSYAGLT
jgi:hypothetical protein